MSYSFNKNYTMNSTDGVYRSLSAWAEKMPTCFNCRIDETHRIVLTILNSSSTTTVKVRGVSGKQTYKSVTEPTYYGFPEMSKHFNLKIRGTDEEGNHFVFKASLLYDSDNGGRSWSGPIECAYLTWK